MENTNNSNKKSLTPEEKALICKQVRSEQTLKKIVAQVLEDENPLIPEEKTQIENVSTLLQRNFGSVYYLLRFMARRNLFPNFLDYVSLHEARNILDATADEFDKFEEDGRLHSHIIDGEQMFSRYELKVLEAMQNQAV